MCVKSELKLTSLCKIIAIYSGAVFFRTQRIRDNNILLFYGQYKCTDLLLLLQCSSKDMPADRQRNKYTDTQAHHNTQLPSQGRVIILLEFTHNHLETPRPLQHTP